MILALKTDGAISSWHVIEPGTDRVIRSWEWESGRSLADGLLERLAASIGAVKPDARDARTAFAGLSGIVVYAGPGSFTSLRIGHTVANALADGLGIPVVGAAGETWIEDGLKGLADARIGVPVMPVYGAEPNVKPPQA